MAIFDIGIKWATQGQNPLEQIPKQLNAATSKIKNAFSALTGAGQKSARDVQAAWLKVGRSMRDFGNKLQGIAGKFNSLGGALAGLGAGAGLKSLVDAGVQANRLDQALKLATGGGEEYNKVIATSAELGAKLGLSGGQAQQGLLSLYSTMKPLGVATDDIVTLFEGVTSEANRMGVGADKVNGVMVQLSQGMASGALRTQDLRAIMNNMPSIMGKLSEATGKTAGELLEMAQNGELGTDVILQLGKTLAEAEKIKPDSFKQFAAEFDNFKSALGQSIVPLLTPLLVALNGLLKVFNALPGPIQGLIGVIVLLAGGLAIILPVIGLIGSGISALGGVITTLVPIIAGMGGAVGILKVALVGIIALITGPVGWIAAIAAIGVAIYAFRDEIGAAFKAIGKILTDAGQAFWDNFVDPAIGFLGKMFDEIVEFGKAIPKLFTDAWKFALDVAKQYVNSMLSLIERAINSMINAINNLVRYANRALRALKLPTIPQAPNISIPKLAKGGYVTGPTVAEIGEGGEPEYVIPQSKLGAAFERYSAGYRGGSMIPDSANVSVNYSGTTMSMDGTSYINRGDVGGIVTQAVNQTLNTLAKSSRRRLEVGLR